MATEYSSKYIFTDDFGGEYIISKKSKTLPTLYGIESKAIKELKSKTKKNLRFKSVSYTQNDNQ